MEFHVGHASHNETVVSIGEKAGALVTVAALTLITSILIPLAIRKKILESFSHKARQKVLTGCLCFGAGVLLATVFLHLLPEACEEIETAMADGFLAHTTFPVAEAIVCCGFFLVYLVEEVAHHFFPHGHADQEISLDMSKDSVRNNVNKELSGTENSEFENDSNLVRRKSSIFVEVVEDYRKDGLMRGESTSIFRAIIIIVAMSFHSLMEGIALGLEEISLDLWMLVIVICCHKLVVGFSLGMELLQQGLRMTPFLGAMITFSLSSPIGGVIGAIIIHTSDKETAAGVLVPTVLNGLAGGCILFVAFCEVLERERCKPNGHLVIIISLMAGWGLMAGLECIPGHDHGE